MRKVIFRMLSKRKSPPAGAKVGLILRIFYEDGKEIAVFYAGPMTMYVNGYGCRVSHASVDRLLKDATSVSAKFYDPKDLVGFIEHTYTHPQENDVDTKLF